MSTTSAPTPRHETPAEWAVRVVEEYGPIPDHILRDIATRLRQPAAGRKEEQSRP